MTGSDMFRVLAATDTLIPGADMTCRKSCKRFRFERARHVRHKVGERGMDARAFITTLCKVW